MDITRQKSICLFKKSIEIGNLKILWMCIKFIDFNNVVIHGRPKDTRENWRNQEKSITQSAIERIVEKLKKRVFQGIIMVACSLFYLIATACYCKLLCVFFTWPLFCWQVINADQPVLSFSFCQTSDYCLKVKFCYFQTVFKLSFRVSVWWKEVKRN